MKDKAVRKIKIPQVKVHKNQHAGILARLLEEGGVGDKVVKSVFKEMRRGIEKIVLRNAR